MLTGRQIREARSLLKLRRSGLAARVKTVSTTTIIRAEAVDDEPPITFAQAAAIQRVLEAAGAEFGPFGFRLRAENNPTSHPLR